MKKSFVLCLVLFLAACSKEANKVQDPGPQFGVGSVGMTINQSEEIVVPLKRDDPASGKLLFINFETDGLKNIKSISKQLICGPLIIPGKARQPSDHESLIFYLSENEFGGLSKLPIESACTLSVVATNGINSKVTRNYPIRFQFDRPQDLKITREVFGNGLLRARYDGTVLLEKVTVTNTLPYEVNLRYQPGLSFTAYPYFEYVLQTNSTPYGKPVPPISACLQIQLNPEKLELTVTNSKTNESGRSSQVILAPGETIVFSTTATVAPEITATIAAAPTFLGPVPYMGPMIRLFKGILLSEASAGAFLYLPKELKQSDEKMIPVSNYGSAPLTGMTPNSQCRMN